MTTLAPLIIEDLPFRRDSAAWRYAEMLDVGSVLVMSQRPGERTMFALWASFPEGEFEQFVRRETAQRLIPYLEPCTPLDRGGTTLTAYIWKDNQP